MKITRITTQKNDDKRLNIYIDDGAGEKFGFGIDMDVFVNYNLKKGLELDDRLIGELLYEDEVKKAFQQALNYLSYRIRSQKEIEDHLVKKEFGESVIAAVIQRLYGYKYIDDAEFAKAYVRTKKRTTTKGPNVLKRELIEKGLSGQHIDMGLQEYSMEEQVEVANAYVRKKGKQSKKQSNSEAKQKLKQTLLQKGFSYEIIEIALTEFVNDEDRGEEWEALMHHGKKAQKKYRNYNDKEFVMKVKQYLYRKGFLMEHINQWIQEYLETDEM
ncbi:recombination regulator RecX [Bacillus solimangrovi]|uniref:recombination regulator RecX n=1 Tax=Bacillus solimangrovi TaxID=1305675 RepID=UPI001FDEAEBD|nr:recombination regulator RecX [Bacillus solimangrovi]